MLPRTQARQMPGFAYTSRELFQQEKHRIFRRTWLCLGREEQVAQAGDYFTLDIMGDPIVVTRDKSGEVRAFLNMCRHRGVPVVEGQGNARGFSCPYHAWYYDLEGRLLAAPHMGQSDVSLEDWRLRPMRVATWRGWIFGSFNLDVEPFADFLAPLEDDLEWFKSAECRLADKVVLTIDCNWKLLLENLIDIYHVPVLHGGSFGAFLKSARDSITFKLLPNGGWRYDQEARPHSKGGRQLFPTLPWLEGQGEGTSHKAGIFPNLNLSLRYDSLRMWQVWPIDIDKTELHMYSLLTPSAFDQPGFRENYEEYKKFILSAIVDEDGPMVVRLQQAMQSDFYVPGPFSHMEGAAHHLMRHYLEIMADMLPVTTTATAGETV